MMTQTDSENSLAILPGRSRLWIFQSSRVLEGEELKQVSDKIYAFIRDWAAHGQQLFAGSTIRFGRFVILAVDEQQAAASGCSIDKMMRFIQEVDADHGLDLLNRMKVAYRDGEDIREVSINHFAELLKNGEVTANTLVFNNLIETLSQLPTHWEVPVGQSWHSNLVP